MNYQSLALVVIAVVIVWMFSQSVRIVPQSEKFVVERLGRLRTVLGPGINFTVPFLDRVAHKISIIERQLPNAKQDAITADNALVQVETSVFYRITEPEKTVYRIRDVDAAIATTVAGIVRAEIGLMQLDQVQSNRAELIMKMKEAVTDVVDDWGIQVTRAEILDVNLDKATRDAMLQQLNAERARRAEVTAAEGRLKSVQLAADGDFYAAAQKANARRILAEAEAFATLTLAQAIRGDGLEAARYQIAMKQVEALTQVAAGSGKQTIILPAAAVDAFGAAASMLKGQNR